MSVKFVVLGAARTGSTLLVRTLNTVPGVRCHGELLSEQVRGYEDGFVPERANPEQRTARAKALRQARDADPVGFVAEALSGTAAANGFKALYSAFLDTRWEAVCSSLLAGGDVRFIHLVRRNGLRRFVSETILRAGGPNHSGMGGRSDQRVRVHIDIGEFRRTDRLVAEQTAAVRERLDGQAVHELSYEELAANTPAAVAGVCAFLGLPVAASEIRPALSKVGASDLAATVSNFEELLRDAHTRPLALSE